MDATTRIRTIEWQEDEDLKHDLEEYVKQSMKRNELLVFVREQYPMYAWSLQTLCHRLNYFKTQYIDLDTDLEAVDEAVDQDPFWVIVLLPASCERFTISKYPVILFMQ